MAKVESGTVETEMVEISVAELRHGLLREFEPVAQGKGLGYSIDVAAGAPEHFVTDPQRLRQVLKNLLANAFKFTERGDVRLEISTAHNGWGPETRSLVTAPSVIALAISDTGIGIDTEHQQRIFEAFAQGDGTTARVYGGTGLGLSISRELAGLLGGEISLTSIAGRGSTFTVYLPFGQPASSPSIGIPTNGKPIVKASAQALVVGRAVAADLPATVLAGHVPAVADIPKRRPPTGLTALTITLWRAPTYWSSMTTPATSSPRRGFSTSH